MLYRVSEDSVDDVVWRSDDLSTMLNFITCIYIGGGKSLCDHLVAC